MDHLFYDFGIYNISDMGITKFVQLIIRSLVDFDILKPYMYIKKIYMLDKL